jgi:hypothetical protein
MAEGKPVVSILRELEFEIVKECWNTYVLADQTRVKGRIILVKLLADKTPLFTVSPTGPSQQAAVKPLFTYVFAISAPLNMKGGENIGGSDRDTPSVGNSNTRKGG